MKPHVQCLFALALLTLGSFLTYRFQATVSVIWGYGAVFVALLHLGYAVCLSRRHGGKVFRACIAVLVTLWVVASFLPLFHHSAKAPQGFERHAHSFWELSHVH